MADLNALIAQGVQFQAPQNPFAQYAQMQQLQQGEQANQMNQLKMQEYERGLQEQNRLRSVVGRPGFDPMNPTHQADAFAAAPTLAPKYIESALTTRKTVADIGKTSADTAKLSFETQLAKTNEAISHIVSLNTPQDAINSIDAKVTSGELTADKADALKNSLAAAPSFAAWKNGALMSTVKQQEQLTLTAPKLEEVRRGDVVDTIDKNVYSPTYMQVLSSKPINMTKFEQADLPIKQAQLAVSQGQLGVAQGNLAVNQGQLEVANKRLTANPPVVAVIDPTTGKQVLVSHDEAIAKRLQPAAALEGLAPKEIQAREAKYPQATAAIKTFEVKSDTLAADMEKLANHPGLSGISGLIYGRTPAVTPAARQAEALYNSIVARGGFAELQNMRASSPTGGALGNVSNQEGQYLRDAFAPINRTQSTPDLKTALMTAANATRAAKQRVRDAYDMTYDYKTGNAPTAAVKAPAGSAPAAATGIDTNNPLLK